MVFLRKNSPPQKKNIFFYLGHLVVVDNYVAFTEWIAFFISNKSSQLLNLVVQEIQPKIRVIQKAVFETETAKQAIFDNVSVIEQRLMPNVPSGPSMAFYSYFISI